MYIHVVRVVCYIRAGTGSSYVLQTVLELSLPVSTSWVPGFQAYAATSCLVCWMSFIEKFLYRNRCLLNMDDWFWINSVQLWKTSLVKCKEFNRWFLLQCGVISPRFDVQLKDLEKWQNNLLPSRQFGFIVLTTSAGIMDHEEARRKHTGGKILGFFF